MSKVWREILLQARMEVEVSHSLNCFVCNAVASAGWDLGHQTEGARIVEEFIDPLLEGSHTLEEWLSSRGVDVYGRLKAEWLAGMYRTLRLQWIDWMLTQPEFAED